MAIKHLLSFILGRNRRFYFCRCFIVSSFSLPTWSFSKMEWFVCKNAAHTRIISILSLPELITLFFPAIFNPWFYAEKWSKTRSLMRFEVFKVFTSKRHTESVKNEGIILKYVWKSTLPIPVNSAGWRSQRIWCPCSRTYNGTLHTFPSMLFYELVDVIHLYRKHLMYFNIFI